MSTAICTLYEGHYHYGVASLINSLHTNGFKGHIYIGYRGALPSWANCVEDNVDYDCSQDWISIKRCNLSDDLMLHFILLKTEYHLTNYKPTFMIDLWRIIDKTTNGIFYFDPDIVIKCSWVFYEEWIRHGVALVHEIVYNDMPPTHPMRNKWIEIIKELNYDVNHQITSYLNGGFCGVSKEKLHFLSIWKDVIDYAIKNKFITAKSFERLDRAKESLFYAQDQDALNIAAMAVPSPISEVGPDGMDFVGAGWLMSHATGSPKPWKKKYLRSALIKAIPPTRSEKEYWNYTNGIIRLYADSSVKRKKYILKLASFIGRFYRKY